MVDVAKRIRTWEAPCDYVAMTNPGCFWPSVQWSQCLPFPPSGGRKRRRPESSRMKKSGSQIGVVYTNLGLTDDHMGSRAFGMGRRDRAAMGLPMCSHVER